MIQIIYSDEFLNHKTGLLHPERPERLTAIVRALRDDPETNQLNWLLPTPVVEREGEIMRMLHKIHTPDYVKGVEVLAKSGGGYIDGDTPVSPDSYDVSLLAISAWWDGVDQVLATGEPVFVIARPPGHHAESSRGMGFCIFANAALTANYALEQPGIERVAILDWDVHHGNGTQALVENNEHIAYCSLHQSPCYPGTGYGNERGKYDNVLNIPMYPQSSLDEYREGFERLAIPFLTGFEPDLLIISAGYDANAADPLASINLQPDDFGIFTDMCLKVTRNIVFGLEGGYALQELGDSVVATVKSCL